MSKPLAFPDYLAEFERHGSGTAFVTRRGYRKERVSYSGIAHAACQFGHELSSRKIGKGARVVIWGENCAEWVIAFLGSIQHGAVPVPLDAFAAPDFAATVIREVGPALLVCSRRLACRSQSSGSYQPHDGASVGIPGEPSLVIPVPLIELEKLRQLISRHPRMPGSIPSFLPQDPLEIVFTSGTTSEPRGVVITHGNIQSNLAPFKPEIEKYLKYERFFHPIRFLSLVPLSHVFGQFMGVFVPPLLGGTVHFLETLNPSEILQTIRRERISVLVTVPRLMESLRSKIERDVGAAGQVLKFKKNFEAARGERFLRRWWRFRSLHLQLGWKFWALVCGGAALDSDTEIFWSRLGFAVAQGYGLTETASLISVNHPFDPHPGSIGKVMPGQEIKLDERGEILVRGRNIAAAYWRGRQLEPLLGQDGWFHTGDLGEIDSAGRLYFKGRSKRVIVTAEGMNVFPEDLEAALRRQPAVKDCVVAGLRREGNSIPCAVLIMSGNGGNAAAAVKGANSNLAPYQQIRHWIIWPDEDFPRTATLKPRMGEIEERILNHAGFELRNFDTSGEKGLSARPQQAGATIIRVIERVTGRKVPPDLDAGLATDLNLSSVERVEILSALEDRYQVELDDGEFTAATTLGDLERLIHNGADDVSRMKTADAISRGSNATESTPAKSDAVNLSKPPTHFTFPRWSGSRPVNALRFVLYYLLIWPATMLLGKPRVLGGEHLRGVHGPVLVISNHVFMIDVGFVLAALPWRFRHCLTVAMDGELLESFHHPPAGFGLFRRLVEKSKYYLLTAIFNVFPLPQKAGFRSTFAFAGESVDRGYNVLVFPEGERTKTGKVGAFRAGIGILAGNLSIPIVPMHLVNLYQFKGRHIAPPNAITVHIGPPVTFPPGTNATAIAKELENRVAALGAMP